ncbi:MAG: hypothetical protein QNL43_03515 [Crocinitomicaceae bacterium]|jgi:hypothetical protein|tara:strand:- start:17830 stop:18213 length:384 start_codon:yes stop_codon:yes gene_type:complete
MKLETIYLKANTPFSKAIQAWCSENANEVVHTKERYELSIELFDSLLIVSENQSISKENWNLKSLFDQNQKSTYRIDINGTLNVAIVNLKLWLHSNKAKHLLVVGKDEIIKNEKLERFLSKLNDLKL